MSSFDQADYNPSLRYDPRSTQTWASGNTKTVTDANVKASSVIFIMWATPIGEFPGIVCSAGSFVITVADALTNVNFKYVIL